MLNSDDEEEVEAKGLGPLLNIDEIGLNKYPLPTQHYQEEYYNQGSLDIKKVPVPVVNS